MMDDRLVGGAQRGPTQVLADQTARATTLGRSGWVVSGLAAAAQSLRAGDPLHYRGLTDALAHGFNPIDFGSDPQAQRAGGAILRDLDARGALDRPARILMASAEGTGVRSQLRGVVTGIRDALGVASLDVLTIDAHALAGVDDSGWQRLFEALEREVATATLGGYALAGPAAAHEPGAFERLFDLVGRVGGANHHWLAVRASVNLSEPAVLCQRSTGVSLVELASQRGIAVIADNALRLQLGARALELGGARADDRFARAHAILADVRRMEAVWAAGLGRRLQSSADGTDASDLFGWGRRLADELYRTKLAPEHWDHIRHEVVGPLLGKVSGSLLAHLREPERGEFAVWWRDYGTSLHAAFGAIEAGLRDRRPDLQSQVEACIDRHASGPASDLPVAAKAIVPLLDRGIACVMVDVNEPVHVHAVLASRTLVGPRWTEAAVQSAAAELAQIASR